jgi:hypothetical protein
MNFWMK